VNIELLKTKIKEASDRIDNENAYITKTKQEIADHLCPFKVGERVVNNQGEREIVDSIRYSVWGCGYNLKTFKIKKDGQPYKYSSDVWDVERYAKDIN